jgi:hypothetical protein
MLLRLNNWQWQQSVTSLLTIKNVKVMGECPKECKREENEICCTSFKGTVDIPSTISDISDNANASSSITGCPGISEEQLFYFFKILKDPKELLTVFRDPHTCRGLIDQENLNFDQQLKIALILDYCSIESFILQCAMSKYFNPLISTLIQNQKVCALYFKDWTRYKYVIELWEAFIVSCLFLRFDRTMHDQLVLLLRDFLKDDHPNDIFHKIAMVCNVLIQVIGMEQVFHIVSDCGKLERFMLC